MILPHPLPGKKKVADTIWGAYSSQSDDELDRMWRKQQKIEGRLGEHWRRPKGMSHCTYDRPVAALIDCEKRRDEAFAVAVGDV